jgi:serine/threonine protein kinase
MTAVEDHDPTRPSDRPEADPYIGRKFGGRYDVLSKIGEGSQARVYVARHVMIDRLVAVKFLLPMLATDRSLVGRFLNEGRAAGSLGHPNIVECLDMGFAPDGAPYLVLELLKGRSLAEEIVQGGPFSASRAAYVGSQIASAVAAAHSRGVVHRDLKPANVLLVERNGRPDHVKVLDFGISKFNAVGSRVTTITGQPLGTPGFMAPEQIEDPQSTDARADVYGLGATLYDMLSGAPPFADVGFPKVLRVIVEEEPPKLGVLRPDLPRTLVSIVERAMNKVPAERFQNMEDLEIALLAFAEEPRRRRTTESLRGAALPAPLSHRLSPIPSQVPSRPRGSIAEPPRARTAIALAILGGVLLLFAGFGAALLFLRGRAPVERAKLEATGVSPPDRKVAREEPRAVTTPSPAEPTALRSDPAKDATTREEPSTRSTRTRAASAVIGKPPARVDPRAGNAEAPNCNPPFYYEGKKKLFKAGCV